MDEKSEHHGLRDVTGGLEPTPVILKDLTTARLDELSNAFVYVTDSALTNGVPISQSAVPRHVPNQDSEADSSDEEYSWKCQCRPSSSRSIVCTVRDGEICQCVGSFGNFYSTSKPSDRPQTLNLKALPENLPLVECSPLCACALACANRLTQRGITVPMEIRPTHTGLGAFITHRIPYGTFVSLYAGEYLTTHEARDRWKEGHTDNYTLSLRIPGSTTHIDPRRIGNVGRFLNHSCAPNCVILVVRWGGGCTWPRAAIFTKRAVEAGEELTLDYGNASGGTVMNPEQSGQEKGGNRTKCLCGSQTCRGWIPYDESL